MCVVVNLIQIMFTSEDHRKLHSEVIRRISGIPTVWERAQMYFAKRTIIYCNIYRILPFLSTDVQTLLI